MSRTGTVEPLYKSTLKTNDLSTQMYWNDAV